MKNPLPYLFFLVFLCGCGVTITSVNTVPPRVSKDLPSKVIGVVEVKGDQNDYFATALSSTLARVEYKNKKRFTIVDRKYIELVLKEQGFQMSMTDIDTMVNFGRLVGIDSGFMVSIDYKTSARKYNEKRKECPEDSDKCYEYRVDCTEGNFVLNSALSLLSYTTAQVLYSTTLSKSMSSRVCNDMSSTEFFSTSGDNTLDSSFGDREEDADSVSHLKDSSDPFVRLVNLSIKEVAKDLGEYKLVSTIEIEKEDKSLNDEAKADFNRAISFAQNNRMDKACEIWNALSLNHPEAVSLLINTGICKEVFADYRGALEIYQKADKMIEGPNDMLNNALERVKNKLSRTE